MVTSTFTNNIVLFSSFTWFCYHYFILLFFFSHTQFGVFFFCMCVDLFIYSKITTRSNRTLCAWTYDEWVIDRMQIKILYSFCQFLRLFFSLPQTLAIRFVSCCIYYESHAAHINCDQIEDKFRCREKKRSVKFGELTNASQIKYWNKVFLKSQKTKNYKFSKWNICLLRICVLWMDGWMEKWSQWNLKSKLTYPSK